MGWPLQQILELPYANFAEYHLAHMEMPGIPSNDEIEDKIEQLKKLNYRDQRDKQDPQ